MTSRLHERHRLVIIRVFETHLVRYQLIMESRLSQRFWGGQVLIEDVDEILDCCGYDAGAPCGADDEVKSSVGMGHYCGGD